MIPKRLIAAARKGSKNVAAQGQINSGTLTHPSSMPTRGGMSGKMTRSRAAFNSNAGFEGGKNTYVQPNNSGYGYVKGNKPKVDLKPTPPEPPPSAPGFKSRIMNYSTVQRSVSGVRRNK